VIGGFPFFLFLILETKDLREKESMFLEFSRDLVGNVRAGTPISKAILNIQSKDYGSLTPYIRKLANQISLGIPIKTALETFARDLDSQTISRAINIISESEKAGGQIEDILESVVRSVSQIEKLKKERRSAMYTLVVQGYIIFLIFIVIMLVMEFKILSIATGLGEMTGSSGDIGGSLGGNIGGLMGGSGGTASAAELARPFLWLLIVQSIFTGLVIGKLSEGSIKAGLKHSFILLVLSVLIDTGAKVLFKAPEVIAGG
jgi:flagellar protein FlaJ